MGCVLDALYALAILIAAPWLFYRAAAAGKYRRGLWTKLTGSAPIRTGRAPCAWFHGVSVGEVHLLRQVVRGFRERHPDWECVISTTTDTGIEEARRCFPDLAVFAWPLDFTWAVRRALARIRPSLVVLAEVELWPNFICIAHRRRVPLVVVNARLSPRSFARYLRLRTLVRPMLAGLELVLAQTQEYGARFRRLGLDPSRVVVTGSVKYDGVAGDRLNPETARLRRLFGLGECERVWIAGSTQHPEEEVALAIFRKLRREFADLRLFLVPRARERFDEVAGILRRAGQPFVRRTEISSPLGRCPEVVLVDTIGELRALWGLGELAYVGGSLDGRRGGQNMIEPAAYGAAVLFGPHVWNFRDVTARLVAANGAIQVADAAGLEAAVKRLLSEPGEARRIGSAAQALVRSQQGATGRTLDRLDLLVATACSRHAA